MTSDRYEPWEDPTLVGTTRVRRPLATDLDAMIVDYVGGMGCVLLSRKYGVAENTVLARLKDPGVVVRHPGQVDVAALQGMAAMRAAGWALKALGEKVRSDSADGCRQAPEPGCVVAQCLQGADEGLLPPLRCGSLLTWPAREGHEHTGPSEHA